MEAWPACVGRSERSRRTALALIGRPPARAALDRCARGWARFSNWGLAGARLHAATPQAPGGLVPAGRPAWQLAAQAHSPAGASPPGSRGEGRSASCPGSFTGGGKPAGVSGEGRAASCPGSFTGGGKPAGVSGRGRARLAAQAHSPAGASPPGSRERAARLAAQAHSPAGASPPGSRERAARLAAQAHSPAGASPPGSRGRGPLG